MTDVFDSYMRPILVTEGPGYTDTPGDRGGPTAWGMTEVRARAAGYAGDMKSMTLELALSIYRLFYWQQPMFSFIVPLMPELAQYLLNIGINQGTAQVSRYPQRALNLLNSGGKDWPDIQVDGVLGAMSRAALSALMRKRGTEGTALMLDMVKAQAAVRYMEIAEGDDTQEKFEFGWQRRAFAPQIGIA